MRYETLFVACTDFLDMFDRCGDAGSYAGDEYKTMLGSSQLRRLRRLTRRPRKPKRKSRAVRLAEALTKIGEGRDEVYGLMEELQDWRDGMEGTNLENTQKYQALCEAIDALESAHDEADQAITEAENIEFPRMFG